MSGIEALSQYCANCIHKDKCWRPCPVVLIAMTEGRSHDEAD